MVWPVFVVLLPWLFSAVFASLAQETLSCGQTSYQVSFEPTRPVVGAGSAKYTFYPIELLFGTDIQFCNLTMPAQPADNKPPTINGLETRLVITYCESCSRCISKLPTLHRLATRVATDAGLQSLLIIVRNTFQGVKIDNTMVKFVQMDDEPEVSNVCELVDSVDSDALRSFSKTSVLFVSISFIILMVISLAWLVFYYVQRFRYAHAKDRLQRRLFNAAKKALTHIPTKPVKTGDKELDSDCPVCIDPYRAGDIVRMLPCRHVFHKTCVDPWLLEHRTCPMCKSDILKAFGYHVNVTSRRRTQFSAPHDDQHVVHVSNEDRLSVDANSTASESNAYPFPVVTEIHDPFSFTPSTSPQLVQVMHATNARGFSIIPLTVHSPSTTIPASTYTPVSATVERHVQTSSPSKSDTPSTGSDTSCAIIDASSRHRRHVVNLVHVRSRSLNAQQRPADRALEVRPTALFRMGTVEGGDPEPATAGPSRPRTSVSVRHAPPSRLRPQTTDGMRRVSVQPPPAFCAPDRNKDGISVESL